MPFDCFFPLFSCECRFTFPGGAAFSCQSVICRSRICRRSPHHVMYASHPEHNQKISCRRSRSRAIRTHMLCVMCYQKAPGSPDFFRFSHAHMCVFRKPDFSQTLPENSGGISKTMPDKNSETDSRKYQVPDWYDMAYWLC